MPLIIENRLAFYHVPRTGGNWIRSTLDKMGVEYELLGEFHSTPEEVPPPADCETFTIIRKPKTWIESWYEVLSSTPADSWAWPIPDWLLFKSCRLDSFPEFIEDVLRINPSCVVEIFARYVSGIDRVGYTEWLECGFEKILSRTIPVLLPVNQGKRKPYQWCPIALHTFLENNPYDNTTEIHAEAERVCNHK
jgi:hypothetical protein